MFLIDVKIIILKNWIFISIALYILHAFEVGYRYMLYFLLEKNGFSYKKNVICVWFYIESTFFYVLWKMKNIKYKKIK